MQTNRDVLYICLSNSLSCRELDEQIDTILMYVR